MATENAAPEPIVTGIGDLSRRLRVLEERYIVLRRKGQLSDENVIETEKELTDRVDKLSSEITELRRVLLEIDDKLDRFLQQVKNSATREDVLVLRKYLEMWDPLTYLTREEAERFLEKRR